MEGGGGHPPQQRERKLSSCLQEPHTFIELLINKNSSPPFHESRQLGRKAQKHISVQSPATKVAAELKEGDFIGAISLACSKDTIAERNNTTLNALRGKHPPPHPDTLIPPAALDSVCTLSLSEEELAQAIRSIPMVQLVDLMV